MKTRLLSCLLLAVLVPALVLAQARPQPVPVARPAAPAAPARPAVTPPAQLPAPPPAIVVNGSPISQQQIHQAIANRWAAQIARQVINDKLVRQEANKLGLKVTPEEVAARFQAERAKSSSEEAFQRKLRERGLTGQAMLESLSTQILLDKLMARQSAVNETEIRKYYDDHKSDYVTPAEINLFAVMTDTIEDAYLVKERLAGGDKFADVAAELSKDPSKDKGGEIGWVKAPVLDSKELSDALFAMEVGTVSSPLRAGNKWHIALIKERRPEQIVTFEDVQKDITVKLQQERAVSQEDYLDMLARRSEIVVNWDPAKHLTQEYARLKQIQVLVDGAPLELSEPPVRLPNGAIIVPAKPVLQAAAARLDWKADDQSLTATTPLGRVKLTVGQTNAIVGTTTLEARQMPAAPVMRGGVLYISPRVPLAALGATLDWDPARNALVIETIEETLPSPTVPPSRSGLEPQ